MLALDRSSPETLLAKQGWLRVAVVYVTRGRPALLVKTLAVLERQTCRPTSIIVSGASEADTDGIVPRGSLKVVHGPKGAAAQRNTALRHLEPDIEYVIFFDDDFLARADWIETAITVFVDHPDIGAITGHLIADGIKGPGLSFEKAEALLDQTPRVAGTGMLEPYSPYGCNMAFRRSAMADRLFDERLVLYAWLEDRDYGAALANSGSRIVKIGSAVGVHMGSKAGRVSGRQLGYSQIVNPFYLHRKGTMPLGALSDHIFRNVSSNLSRALFPERHIDRMGRLRGNLRGFADVMRGRFTPERAADL